MHSKAAEEPDFLTGYVERAVSGSPKKLAIKYASHRILLLFRDHLNFFKGHCVLGNAARHLAVAKSPIVRTHFGFNRVNSPLTLKGSLYNEFELAHCPEILKEEFGQL